MLPLAAEPCGGRSSLSISERTLAILLGLALRTISELLRVSTRIDGAAVPRFCAPGAPAAGPPLSVRRCSSGCDVGGDRVAQRDHLDVAGSRRVHAWR